MARKMPSWFKPEVSLGSILISAAGGALTVIVIPYFKWLTLSVLALQADVADIKKVIVPKQASAFPIHQEYRRQEDSPHLLVEGRRPSPHRPVDGPVAFAIVDPELSSTRRRRGR
jgi:hypothetical protein